MNEAAASKDIQLTPEAAGIQREAISRALKRAARQASLPASVISGGSSVRVSKRDRYFRLGVIVSLILIVIAPFTVESLYWGLIASDQYATDIKFAVRSEDAQPTMAVAMPGTSNGGGDTQYTQIIAEYIESPAIVKKLDKAINLRAIFSKPGVDYFSRFAPSEPFEELSRYWNKRVTVKTDSLSGIISVTVRAFTPEDSLKIADSVMEDSETLVNQLMNRSRRDALARSERELKLAEQRLKEKTARLRETRNAEGVIDATAAAAALYGVVGTLQVNLAQARQDLAALGPKVENSPTARVLRTKISALESQIAEYNQQIAGAEATKAGASMANRIDPLSRARTELELATQQFALATVAYQSARTDLEAQHSYVMAFLKPTLAQKATYPRRWLEWSIIVLPCAFGWGLLVALAMLVRDNLAK